MELTDKNIVKKAVFNRPDDANKGTLGSLLSICGCYSMAGAGIMAGKAALRCGIGLLKSAVVKSIYPIEAGAIFESVFFPCEETCDGKLSKNNIDFLLNEAQRSSAVLIGCGLSVCEDTKEIVFSIIENSSVPMVLDADALNCVAQYPDILKRAKNQIIITPHPAEMARLISGSTKAVNQNRACIASDFSAKYGVVTVLKGMGTIIASPNGRIMQNNTGNSGMATGGSGDVLAGMVSSLLAQGAEAFEAAAAGVYLHGLAGDIAKSRYGKISMLPTDIIECISEALKACGF